MTNFKGTKGKWQFVRYEKTFTIETFGITNWTILQTITNEPQDEANAKLIACAPEMLEMLESIAQSFESDYVMLDGKIVDNPYEWLKEDYLKAKQLIKKATE